MVATYPGTKLNVTIAAIGQLDGLTQANVRLQYDEVFDYGEKDESDFVNYTCTNITRDMFVKRTDTRGYIYLTVSNYYVPDSLNQPITIVVDLLPCPPGFTFSDVNRTCICSECIKESAQCNITSKRITRNSNSWISPANDSIMILEHCPFDYCNNEPFFVDNPDGQCNSNRSGTLCGNCIQGHSLSLGSNQCLNCTHQVWKLPVILLGSALAGIGLVILLLGLNLTVSVGTINGILFFVNVIKIYESLFFNYNHSSVLHYFISWLNLDLGISTCFFNRMDSCQKVGLQFVFPLYLLFLVLLIVAVCRCGQWMVFRSLPWVVKISDKASFLMGSKTVPVLATLLLLSYTKLIRGIILIYRKADIKVFDPNANISDFRTSSVWYVSGSVEYLTGCHMLLFGLTTGITVPFISLFTAFLLLFPLMERHLPQLNCWTSWHIRLKPWYDAYGGPYKDEYRFWTGLLLLLRCVLVLVFTIESDPEVSMGILRWLCFILIPLVAFLQIYKSRLLNVLETVCLLCVLSMVSLFSAPESVQLYLVMGISFGLFVFILCFHLHQHLKSTRLAGFLRQMITNMRMAPFANKELHSVNQTEQDGSRNVPVSIITIASIDEEREPLLKEAIDS